MGIAHHAKASVPFSPLWFFTRSPFRAFHPSDARLFENCFQCIQQCPRRLEAFPLAPPFLFHKAFPGKDKCQSFPGIRGNPTSGVVGPFFWSQTEPKTQVLTIK